MHLDALMRRLIHLQGPFPIVIGGTGRIAVVMLPDMRHFMREGGQHCLDAACAGLLYCTIKFWPLGVSRFYTSCLPTFNFKNLGPKQRSHLLYETDQLQW
jgi:hypothetical protein